MWAALPSLRRACLLALVAFTSASCETSIRYRAAIVEIAPELPNATDRRGALIQELRNVRTLNHWAGEAARRGAQIVVFPEDYLDLGEGLTQRTTPLYAEFLPEPRPGISLCSGGKVWSSVAQAAACIAKEHGIIIVSGIGDVGPCSLHRNPFNNASFPCDNVTGLARFNSMAAFGRDGSLLAKYRKAHLAGNRFIPDLEAWAEWDVPEVAAFDSHFGVRFGMTICNDANFGGPILGILKEGVRDIIFSTSWINTSPLLMAAPFQDSFSRAHAVNFLAANSDSAGLGGCGSGIWPANTSAPSLQHLCEGRQKPRPTEGWMGVLDIDGVAVTKTIPEAVQHPQGAATLGQEGSIDVSIAIFKVGSLMRVNASVPGVDCNFEAEVAEGSGAFGIIASAGIHSMGWYTARCALVPCPDGVSESDCQALLRSCARDDAPGGPDQACRDYIMDKARAAWVSSGPRLGDAKLNIKAPGSNVFFPSAMCNNYTVAEPRSSVSVYIVGEGERVLKVAAGACQVVGAYYIEARAQEESEMPEGRSESKSTKSGLTLSHSMQAIVV